jgi:hypothetical protein
MVYMGVRNEDRVKRWEIRQLDSRPAYSGEEPA